MIGAKKVRDEEFRAWLQENGANSQNARNTRAYAIRKIESAMAEMGSRHGDLEAAWEADEFAQLRARLKGIKSDAQAGGQDYRILMPDSENPANRLSNWASWLAQYGRFLEQTASPDAVIADRIREFVLERYISPVRQAGKDHVEILVREVNDVMQLNQAWPNICQVLEGSKFRSVAEVPPPQRIGAKQSPATVYRFSLQASNVRLKESPPMQPTNLILHGPPGTGKTYATAAEALRLCGEPVPDNREEVMSAYNRLRAEKRIEFVTFHQSMSYEEFIEGRQPTTEDDAEGGSGTGFRLETVPGIFRRIAKTAGSIGTGAEPQDLYDDRKFWIFSAVDVRYEEDGYPWQQCLSERCLLLNFGGQINLESEEFDDAEAVAKKWRTVPGQETHNSNNGKLQALQKFRTNMSKGDIVFLTNRAGYATAVGQIASRYYHIEGPLGHGLEVNWIYAKSENETAIPVRAEGPLTPTYDTIWISEVDPHRLSDTARAICKAHLGASVTVTEADGHPHVLIIDEINRANISKVFGELITLIEPDKRLGQPNALTVRLPYSGDEFGVPANLHILGTMNTADRSIALLDTALRRRFEFREMMPEPDIKEMHDAAERCGLDLPRILTVLNDRIEYLYDREHQIGHAYFINCTSREDVDAVMRHKVIPLLAEYFFEDLGKVAAVLGDAETHEGAIEAGFMNRLPLTAPPGLDEDGDGMPRFRWSLRDGAFSYDRLTGR